LQQIHDFRKGNGLQQEVTLSTLPTLQRRLRIYTGRVEKGVGTQPSFLDSSLVLLAAADARDAIVWHEKRLTHLRHVLRRIEADGRNWRRLQAEGRELLRERRPF
jgi:hypothetical protein